MLAVAPPTFADDSAELELVYTRSIRRLAIRAKNGGTTALLAIEPAGWWSGVMFSTTRGGSESRRAGDDAGQDFTPEGRRWSRPFLLVPPPVIAAPMV